MIFVLVCFVNVSYGQHTQSKENQDSLIIFHYKQLESFVNAHPDQDKYYCCSGSIIFIESRSFIASSSPGTFGGKLYFTKSDFTKWTNWYLTRYFKHTPTR